MRPVPVSSLAFVGWLAAACAPASPPPPDLAAEADAIRAISSQWLALEKANDYAGIAALFTEDGTLYREDKEPVVGAAAIQALMTADRAENPQSVADWATDRVEVAASADLAVEYGTWSTTGGGADGTGTDMGRYTTVYRKVNGVWKVAADLSYSTKPEAAPAM